MFDGVALSFCATDKTVITHLLVFSLRFSLEIFQRHHTLDYFSDRRNNFLQHVGLVLLIATLTS